MKTQFLCILLLSFMMSLKSFGQCSGPLGFDIHTLHHPSTQVSTDGSFEFNYYAQCGLAGSFRVLLKRRVNVVDIGVTVYDQSWPWPADAEPLGGGCISSFFSYETISNLQAGYYDIQFITDVPSQYCDTTYFYNVFQLIPNTLLWYLNADGDNYYTGSPVTQASSPGTGWTSELPPGGSGDCADDPTANPNAINIHPGAIEVCGNGIDENCNGMADDVCQIWYHDADGDGYYTGNPVIQGASPGTGWVTGLLAANSGDCADDPSVNPNAANIHPGATEACNGYDDNCDSQVDEGFTNLRSAFEDNNVKAIDGRKEYYGKAADEKIKGASIIKEREESSFPALVRFKDSQQIAFADFIPWLKNTLRMAPYFDFQMQKSETDNKGVKHYRYAQTYKGIPIENAIYVVNVINDKVVSFNGQLIDVSSDYNAMPVINERTAIENAKRFTGATLFNWESAFSENSRNSNSTYFPKGELCWLADKSDKTKKTSNLKLAYQLDVFALSPDIAERIFVDADSGFIIKAEPLGAACNPTPTQVPTIFNGPKNINTTLDAGTNEYELHDDCLGIYIKNANDGLIISAPDNNSWDSPSDRKFGATALWALESTYNYFKNVFNRNSYDDVGNGAIIYAYINAPVANAFMRTNGEMYISAGPDANDLNNSYATLDILAHEFTHNITFFSPAKLSLKGEAGALNESFGDIFGEVVENSVHPNDWLHGGERTAGFSRSLGDPKSSPPPSGPQPNTYHGEYWKDTNNGGSDGGAHINAGVQNYWFYLLANGGDGVNDKFNTYHVDPVGIEAATDLVYKSLTIYLTDKNSTYYDARTASINAATYISFEDPCSDLVKSVTNAWYAVGVGEPFLSATAISTAGESCGISCDGIASVIVQGGNGTPSILWDDPLSQSSKDAYGLCPGTYTVVVTDGSGCTASASATIQAHANFASVTQTWYRDADNDGYYSLVREDCSSPGTGWTTTQPINGGCDCNDNDTTAHTLNPFFIDADHDDYGSTVSEMKCATLPPYGYSNNNTDCNDNEPLVHQVVTWYLDLDEDGYYVASQSSCSFPGNGWSMDVTLLSGDCNDNDPTVHEEIFYYLDNDSDGYGGATQELLCASTAPLGYSINSTDCNDADSTIHPNAFEACNNGIDENCDNIDEQCTECYTILATSKAVLNKNTVLRGAVGVNGLGNKAMVQDSTIITAFATMVRADDIVVRGLSEVATQSLFPAAVSLPPFETSNYTGGTDIVVDEGGTATLSGAVYKNITLGNNATVIFSNSTVDVKSITSGFGAKFKFTNCTRLHVRQALTMGRRNFFNADKKEVIVYDGGNVSIGRRTKFSGILYARGDVTLEDGYRDQGTQIDGLIIGSLINSGKYVQWTRTCNMMTCLPPFSLKSGVESYAAVILKAYPNPFTDKLNIEFTLPEDSKAILEIYNMAGQKLAVIFNGNVKANEVNKVEYVPNNAASNMIIYRLQTEKGIYFNKGVMSQ